MTIDRRTLRPYVPLAVLLITIALGWLIFVRPVTDDRARSQSQIESLRQREIALRRELSVPSPRAAAIDPAAVFARRVSAGDASAALLEQLARLASSARARNLLIETVEGSAPGAASPAQAAQRDPRLGLFDTPLSHVPIRVAFDTDYASAGRFLWGFRDLPTTVEIRSVSLGVPATSPGVETARASGLRLSLTLQAYSRPTPAVVRASNTVTR
jgi:hypothetical protein